MINRKTAAITLLLVTACAVAIGGLMMTVQATETNSTTSVTTDLNSDANSLQLWDINDMATGDQGFGRGSGGHGGVRGGMGNIEISAEYTANVNTILESDSDVQDLISQGYNVTSINPIVKSVIEADGTLATKATTALVTLQNDTSGYATVKVDIEEAKVTQIVIITRTVIDKTTT